MVNVVLILGPIVDQDEVLDNLDEILFL